jgi:simple sugar transport system substrate-binding protein
MRTAGQSTDMSKFATDTQLTASTDVWGPYYIKRIQEVLSGTWKSTDTWGGFDSGMLAMSPFTNMPADVAALATSTVADITAGKNKVFVGPITDQTGAVKVPAGTTMDDEALSKMQWLAQGVDGKLT